jgi:hypothetical protein
MNMAAWDSTVCSWPLTFYEISLTEATETFVSANFAITVARSDEPVSYRLHYLVVQQCWGWCAVRWLVSMSPFKWRHMMHCIIWNFCTRQRNICIFMIKNCLKTFPDTTQGALLPSRSLRAPIAAGFLWPVLSKEPYCPVGLCERQLQLASCGRFAIGSMHSVAPVREQPKWYKEDISGWRQRKFRRCIQDSKWNWTGACLRCTGNGLVANVTSLYHWNWRCSYNEYPRDGVIGIATGYWLDDRGVEVRVPVGSRIFSSGVHPTSYSVVTGALSPW